MESVSSHIPKSFLKNHSESYFSRSRLLNGHEFESQQWLLKYFLQRRCARPNIYIDVMSVMFGQVNFIVMTQ